MSIAYSKDVAQGQHFRFVRLLFRWHGSFYKLIVYEFAIYFVAYFLLNIVHSFLLNDEQEAKFNEFCAQLGGMSGYVVASVTFCLGFFIQHVYRRFCYHFQVVPWPDAFAFLVSVNVRGKDMRGRLLRRTMVRYAVASIILTWMNFSERLKVLFPDLDSLVVSGFLTENEVTLMKSVGRPAWRQMVAASWCAAVVKRARMEKRIEDDYAFNAILQQLDILRMRCRRLISQNNRPTPLAYFHTVIIGVYSFFWIAAIAGSHRAQTQKLHKTLMADNNPADVWMLRLLSQVITMVQFAICAGVLAISRSLLTPFGKDDDNINVEEIVRRHLGLAYLIVDELHSLIPEIKDGGTESSIFQVGEEGFPLHLQRQGRNKKKQRIRSVYEEEAIAKPGYIMSVAPRRPSLQQEDQPSTSTAQSSSQSKAENIKSRPRQRLQRLLSFRKLN